MSLRLEDSSNALGYDDNEVMKMNFSGSTKGLPGWSTGYTAEELKYLPDSYKELTHEDMWRNLADFFKKAVSVAEEAGVRRDIHPDDPPWKTPKEFDPKN